MMKLAMMKSFVARATLPRLFLPVQKLQQGSSKRACLCVYVCVCGCGCVSVRVCVSQCVRVIVEAFAVAAFLDTTFWFFSAADPSGSLWAVCAVGVAGRQRFVAYFNFVVCSRKRKLFHCILWSSPSRRSLYLPPSLSFSPSFNPLPAPFFSLLCECGKFVILNFWQRHELLLSQRKVFTWRTQEAA